MADNMFEKIQHAERQIYHALRPLPKQIRDRVLRNVNEALNADRVPLRLLPNFNSESKS